MERRIKRQDTRRASTVLFVSLNKKIKNVWVHLNCTVHWAQSTPSQASALSTQCTTNLEHSHALSTQCRLTWQALALSVTDLLGIKVQVRASCVVLVQMDKWGLCVSLKQNVLCDWRSYFDTTLIHVWWAHTRNGVPRVHVFLEIFIFYCLFTGKKRFFQKPVLRRFLKVLGSLRSRTHIVDLKKLN